MPAEIIVPPLSQTMDSVVLAGWLKQPGDAVTKGEPLFTVETDKATLEVEAPASGILAEVRAAAGDEVTVKSVIGLIAVADEAPAPGGEPARQAPPAGRPLRLLASPRARRLAATEQVDLGHVAPTGPRGMRVERDVRAHLSAQRAPSPAEAAGELGQPPAVRLTPVARRVAEASGLDPAALRPAEPGQRLTRADVEAALEAGGGKPEPEAAAGTGAGAALSPTRRTIARRMAESWRNAPQVTLTREVDATGLVELREQLLAELAAQAGPAGGEPRLSVTALLGAIVVRCLRNHPALNALTDGERIDVREEIHLGIAVDTERGLVVPVVRDADKLGLVPLSEAIAAAVRAAANGTAGPEAYQGGTFTLTNLGPQGIDAFTPIVNPPQVAILGLGRIRPAPAVHQGQLCVRQMTVLSLTFDHRAVDGAPAARFLAEVAARIEKPYLSWL